MRRITRNEPIKDIKPERERGSVVFKLPPRGDTEHDPMFSRPSYAWYSGLGPFPVSPTPAAPEPKPVTIDAYYEVLPEPPEPELSDRDRLWKAAVECADEANIVLRDEPDYDYMELLTAIEDMVIIDQPPTAADIVAAYRKRMEAKRG
jgi:hypothetical protein